MASQGVAVAIVSSELEEVVAVADRVLVLSRGRMTGLLDGQDGEITMSAILARIRHDGGGEMRFSLETREPRPGGRAAACRAARVD